MSKDYRRQGLLRIVVSLGNGALTVKAPTDKAVLNEIATLDIAIAKILCRSEAEALGLRPSRTIVPCATRDRPRINTGTKGSVRNGFVFARLRLLTPTSTHHSNYQLSTPFQLHPLSNAAIRRSR